MTLAPIILFVYNRPWHTEQTLNALVLNELANKSTLYIYCDGAKENASEATLNSIKAVRELIRKKKWCKEVFIIEREENIGLANSVIKGVTEVVNRHGKIIVLEDDIVTSPYFLRFMNNSLNFYENESRIMQISAFQYPVNLKFKRRSYIHRRTTSWGWATWRNAWSYFIEDVNFIVEKFNTKEKYIFNIDDTTNRYGMLEMQQKNKINSWAIRWAASVHLNKGLVLWPGKGLVKNIGFDGSGVHCGKIVNNIINFSEEDIIFKLPKKIIENERYLKLMKKYYIGYNEMNIKKKIKFNLEHYLLINKQMSK